MPLANGILAPRQGSHQEVRSGYCPRSTSGCQCYHGVEELLEEIGRDILVTCLGSALKYPLFSIYSHYLQASSSSDDGGISPIRFRFLMPESGPIDRTS